MHIPLLFFALATHYLLSRASDSSPSSDDCATFDSCRTGEELFRTCSCDRDCPDYGTCCRDSDNAQEMAPPNATEFRCHSERTVTPVYAKRACLDSFSGHVAYRHLCEEAEHDRADVLGNVLVTSLRTRVTYWNRDCGMCNDEDPNDLRLWIVQVTCPSKHGETRFNQNYIESHLHFDLDIEQWGLKVEDGFKVCHITFSQPRRKTGKLSYCAPNLVSDCPPGFADRGVVERCHAYHAERRRRGTEAEYYRNAHCALCNGVGEEELECVGRSYVPVGVDRGRDQVKVSFDQEWLEREGAEKYKCSRNNSWDPFNNRCRKLPLDIWKHITTKPVAKSHAYRTISHFYIIAIISCIAFFNKYTPK